MPEHDQFSFRSIEIFIAVIEERSITAAAKRMGCSASTVSSQLSKLERSMGVTLIKRSAQHFELTAAGEQFVPRAKAILDEVLAAKADFSQQGYSTNLHLRIAVIEDFDVNVLPHWLARIKRIYPHCTFDIRSGTSHEGHAALFSRQVDIIVASDNTRLVDGIDQHPLLRDPFVMVASGRAAQAVSMSELLAFPFVRHSSEQLLAQQIEAQLRRSKFKPEKGLECSSTAAVYSLVSRFNGWAISTASAVLGSAGALSEINGQLIVKDLPLSTFSRTISLYHRVETLGGMPEELAMHLRDTLRESLIPVAADLMPFLGDRLFTIDNSEQSNN